MNRNNKFLLTLGWVVGTITCTYLIDLWLNGMAGRLTANPNRTFFELWLAIIARLVVSIIWLLLFRFSLRGERSTAASILLIVMGVALMIYPALLNVMIIQGRLQSEPLIGYSVNSLTGYSGSLLAAVGILALVIVKEE